MTHPKTRPYGPKRHRDGQPDLHGLDELHRRLVKAACAGTMAEFEKTDVLDANVLAALITGRSYNGRAPWPVASKGVRIAGGRVETRLDLSQSRIEWPLALTGTYLTEGVNIEDSQARGLFFNHCTLKDLNLSGAHVTGQFSANNATFNTPDGDALRAHGAEITDGVYVRNARINGECNIAGAKIGGQFSANGTKFNTPCGIALQAQGAEIKDSAFLDKATVNGQCAINRAKIGGQFSADDAKFNTTDGIALRAHSAKITDGVYLRNATLNGECNIAGAKIGGQFNAKGATFKTHYGDALNAQGSEVADIVFLNNATLKGICDFNSAQTAEIFLKGATLTGQLRGDYGARIKRLELRGARLISAWHAQLEAAPSDTPDPEDEPKTPTDPRVLDLTDARIGRLDMPQSPQHQIKGVVILTRCHVEHFCDHKRAWPDALERRNDTWKTPQSRRDPETGKDIGYFELNGFTYDYLAAPNGGSADGAEESTAQARKRWLLSQHAHHVADHFKPQPWRQMAARLEAQGHDDAARKIAEHRRRYHRYSKATRGFDVFMSWVLDITSHYGFDPWLTLRRSAYVIIAFALIYGLMAWTGPMPDGGYSPMAGYTAAGPASDANANPPPVFIRAEADDVTAATNVQDLAQADPFLSRVYPDFNPLLYSLDVFVPVLDLGMDRYWRPNPNHLRPAWGETLWMTGSALYWLTILQRFLGAILIAIMVTSFTGLLTREDKLS
ncbi:hypothetical protein [Oceanicaulis sp.]|uniref:hypothetical protein n=1 Tax=Oceanicaulis sp. TaxID=1924941 RepID=UPI003F6F94A7